MQHESLMMMIAFITIKSSLVPLIEGLCAQSPCPKTKNSNVNCTQKKGTNNSPDTVLVRVNLLSSHLCSGYCSWGHLNVHTHTVNGTHTHTTSCNETFGRRCHGMHVRSTLPGRWGWNLVSGSTNNSKTSMRKKNLYSVIDVVRITPYEIV